MERAPAGDAPSPSFERIPHTADVGIRAWGMDLPGLFSAAAAGMADILFAPKGGAGAPAASPAARPVEDAVSAEGEDLPDLLHAWLSEILFRAVAEAKAFSAFEVSRIAPPDAAAAGPWRIEGKARGEAFDPARHALLTELKAVTYHDLSVVGKGGRFEATVLFDV